MYCRSIYSISGGEKKKQVRRNKLAPGLQFLPANYRAVNSGTEPVSIFHILLNVYADEVNNRYIRSPRRVYLELSGRLAQLVECRTREHNVSGLYRCGFESPAGQLKLLSFG